MIARTPTDLQSVMDATAENAATLCDAADAAVWRVDGDVLRLAAHFGPIPMKVVRGEGQGLTRGTPPGRAVIDGQTIHIHDIALEVDTEYPEIKEIQKKINQRTTLAVPLLRDGLSIGAILIRRLEVRPFVNEQIKLLETFADQAVIAIENTRLFQELSDKSAKLESSNSELREALEQQTATGQILNVIASSPTDIQPVLDAIAENAARVCNANDASIRLAEGNMLRLAAHHGPIPFFAASELPIDRDSVVGRALVERQLIHIEDLLSVVVTEFPRFHTFIHQEGTRTVLVAPLMREDVPIGTVLIRQTEVRPFTEKQIALLKTFADQAVIAIENVRLFKELQQRNRDLTEALEQQTATSEILRVISSSPTDVQPVFDTIARNAVTLCDSLFANVFRFDGEQLHFVSNHNALPKPVEIMRRLYPMRPDVTQVSGRVILTKSIVHMDDALADPDYDHRFPIAGGWRRMLGVPMMRDEGVPLGAIVVAWNEPGPIPKHQEELLKTFADQAVIAIENVLFMSSKVLNSKPQR
jgi:GAF domain-containing protein